MSSHETDGSNPPIPRWGRFVQSGVFVIVAAITVAFAAVAVGAALTGRWAVAVVAFLPVVWRIGLRRLIRRNEREVKHWQRRDLTNS